MGVAENRPHAKRGLMAPDRTVVGKRGEECSLTALE
jgi:hypothetical protein